MATTSSFVKLRNAAGGYSIQAMGSHTGAVNAGTFAVRLEATGSAVLRNIETVQISNKGTESVLVGGQGSSGIYVTLSTARVGSTDDETCFRVGDGTVDIYWAVTGGGGSV